MVCGSACLALCLWQEVREVTRTHDMKGHIIMANAKVSTQDKAIDATQGAVDSLIGMAKAINTTNLDIGRVFNTLAKGSDVVAANTPTGERRDDTDSGMTSALGAIAQRAGLSKQRVSEWRKNARVHDIGLGLGLDMDRCGVSVGKDLSAKADDASIGAALTTAFGKVDDAGKAKVAKAKGKTAKAAARKAAKVAPVARKAINEAAGIAPKASGSNAEVVVSINNDIALAAAAKAVTDVLGKLADDATAGNVLKGNSRKVATRLITMLEVALADKVVKAA